MEEWELSALDAYTNRVYKIIVLIIPIFCICASATIICLHYMGYYPDVNEKALWAFGLLFTIVEAFFFDIKLVAFSTVGISVSMFLSWFVKGERLLPPMDDYFVANMTFRMVGIFLMFLSVNIITYFGGKFLMEEFFFGSSRFAELFWVQM